MYVWINMLCIKVTACFSDNSFFYAHLFYKERTFLMPENTTNGESEKQSFSPLTSTFYSRYTWLSVVSVIPAAVAVFMGSEDLGYMIDVTAAALIVIFFGIIKYSLLKKREISLDMMIKNEKALDSRLMGSLGDIGGIGSTVAAVAGIAYAFINLYVRDGGVFSSGDFYIPLLNISSKAISIGMLLACITSKESISASLYIIAGRTFKASGKDLIKKACRVTHSTEAMKYLRNMAVIKLTTSLSVGTLSVICIVSGTGSPYSCIQLAVIYVLTVVLSDMTACPSGKSFTEEKLSLWDKKHKSMCDINSIMFVIIGFFFIFSFPIQSVYSNYSTVNQYDYYEEVDNTIRAFSVPDTATESAPLLTGLFLITVFMMTIVSASSLTNKDDLVGGFIPFAHYKTGLIAIAAGIVVTVICSIIYPHMALDPLQWLVALSIACLIIIINIISSAILNRKSN